MSTIRITNHSTRTATIDIEGVIGLAENIQFEQPEARVATYEKFRDTVERIRELKTPRVVVNIRSAGGDVNDALLIHDSLVGLGAQVTTRCYGYVASAATIIAQAASKGRREISSNALYLIHNAVSKAEGNAQALGQTIDLLDKTDDRIAAVYAARSGRSEQEFLALMGENEGKGRWLSPHEAVDAGLVDKIIRSEPITNAAAEQIRSLGLPGIPQQSQQPQTGGIGTWVDRLLALLGFWQEEETLLVHQASEADGTVSPQAIAKAVDAAEKVPGLQAGSAKQRAKATETVQKEDPALVQAAVSANRGAYEQDALSFK